MRYDHSKDEARMVTLSEFVALAKEELRLYELDRKDCDKFHSKPHTWEVWWSAFHRYVKCRLKED